MNLVIDCFKLVKGAGKSIGIYNLTKSLVDYLARRQTEKSAAGNDRIIVLGNRHNRPDFAVDGIIFVEITKNPLNKLSCILWELFGVNARLKKHHADRVLFPRGFAPLHCSVRDTIIVHDMIPFFYHENYPEVFNRLENAYIMNRLKASIKHADRIITISDTSRQEIMKKVPQSADRITVIYNGLNHVSARPETASAAEPQPAAAAPAIETAPASEIPQPATAAPVPSSHTPKYIAAVTSELPHKNARGIIRAYEAYWRSGTDPLELKIVGIGDAAQMVQDPQVLKHIHCHKYIGKFQDMCTLIAGAEIFLFLSYAEGFGFPPLEAMQLGVPVVCSNRSSLPEVTGAAAILVDPDDAAAVAAAIRKMTQENDTRENYIAAGYDNIKRFTWDSQGLLYEKELFR